MQVTDNNQEQSSDEDLINLAYSMAVEPQRLTAFIRILNDRAQSVSLLEQNTSEASEKIQDNLNNIATHFQHAFDLMERQGRRFRYATGSMSYINADTRPSALVFPEGKIFHLNSVAEHTLGLRKGESLREENFAPGQFKKFRHNLKNIAKHETDKIISVYDVLTKDGQGSIKMALSKAIDYKNHPIGRLSTFHIQWLEERGKQFQQGFDLTDVDIAITKAIISGTSLKDLAKERGRSLATIRTQTKALLAKLSLHSQVELACLYSGFTHYNLHTTTPAEITKPKRAKWRKIDFLDLPDGRKLQYEIVGPPAGRPVLYFHGLVDGMIVPQKIRDILVRQNIKLIMVWRPFFAGSSPDPKVKGAIERFARDIKTLLDHLGIAKCQILGVSQGGIYAYGCARQLPERILGIVNCSTGVPITSRKQFARMHLSPRIHILLARYSPLLLPMMVRAMLSKIDAGYDEEFLLEHYENSPADLQTIYIPEMTKLLREAYPVYTKQGYMPFVRNAQIEASHWGYLAEDLPCPVTLVHGNQHHAYPLDMVEEFIKDKPNFELIPIIGAGQLVYYQATDRIYQALQAQYDSILNP